MYKKVKAIKICHAAMEKIQNYCKTNYLTKEQVKKYKRKKGKWTDDYKSAYLPEDLAYKLIFYTNADMIEVNEFRKNLGVENEQSIPIEREIIALIMKIFAKRNYSNAVKNSWTTLSY